jgi:hypothetical protein
MGCYTGYLLREIDGSVRFATTKHGHWTLVDDTRRAEVVDWVREEGRLVDAADRATFDSTTCRGVALDLRDKVFRCFPCYADDGVHKESLDMQIRTAPHWEGWDAGLAWGGREELGEVIPEARHVIEPFDLGYRPLADLPIADRDTYDGNLVSVITEDLQVLDYQFKRDYNVDVDLLPWLVHGPALVDALRGEAPFELPWEDPDAGIVIDLDRRTVRYWTEDVVPARLVSEVRTAWPGFDVRWLPYDMTGHLAATGRRDDVLAPAFAASEEWEAARRALEPDPRPLRLPPDD